MKFKTWKYYVFDPSTSMGDPYNDLITTASIPFQGKN